jgi:hypothetical protein
VCSRSIVRLEYSTGGRLIPLVLVPDAAGTAAIGLLGYSLIGRNGAAVRSPRCPDGRESRVAIPASNWKGARPHSRRGRAFFCFLKAVLVRSFYNARAAAPPQISMLERMPPNPHNMGTA